jgi:hypothetical protein
MHGHMNVKFLPFFIPLIHFSKSFLFFMLSSASEIKIVDAFDYM